MSSLSSALSFANLAAGDLVMVHASMRKVGGRAEDVVRALLSLGLTVMAYVDFEGPAPFDSVHSPAQRAHGVFAEVVRTWPGAVRGPGTPLGRLVEADGKVLLLGSDFNHVTLMHYAEHVARIPNKRVVIDGDIEEFDTSEGVVAAMPEDYFATVVRAFIASGQASSRGDWHAFSARAFVAFAVACLEHAYGE